MKTMTKAELIEKIIDALTDPYTDSDEDIATCDFIGLRMAKSMLSDIRYFEHMADIDPDDRLPDDVTPDLVMEAWNCRIRQARYTVKVDRLAEWITETEPVCIYDQYKDEYLKDPLVVLPVDFLHEDTFPFKLIDDAYPSPFFLIELGQRSPEFNLSHEYCWYDRDEDQLFSTNTPFADGTISAKDLAEYALTAQDHECLEEILSCMTDKDALLVFGLNKSDLRTELNMKGV